MEIVKILFWASLFILFYSYIGYGILLYCILKIRKLTRPHTGEQTGARFEPEVTLLVAAFNEQSFIEKKIRNSLQLDYPREKLHFIFITDGSTDATPEIVAKYNNILLLHSHERRGKIAAINKAMAYVKTPVVVFCDANTLLNKECIYEIVKFYADPLVGGVAGEKRIMNLSDARAAGAGEGLYWKYESLLKKLDSDLYTVVGAAGELFSIRTNLYTVQPENIILDDFVISLQICMQGYTIKYEPNAYAMESPSLFMKDEQKRKIRISAGGFQSMAMLKDLLNMRRYTLLSFQYISHRVLRWTLCPLCLFILFIANFILYYNTGSSFYASLFFIQIIFYVFSIAGLLLANNNIKVKFLFVPYYFFFMNMSLVLGFIRYLGNKQSVLWDKAAR